MRMTGPTIHGIDHLVMVVRNLEGAMADLREVGFGVVRGGQHIDGRTENALVRLEDGSYIEVVGFLGEPEAKGHRWEWALAVGGFADYALSVESVAPFGFLFEQLALPTRGPIEGGRRRPDGVRIAWRTLRVSSGRWLPFLIDDITPRDQRVPARDQDALEPPRLIGVTVGVHDLARASEVFARLAGEPGARIGSGVRFYVGSHQLTLTAVPAAVREGVMEAFISAKERFAPRGMLPIDKTHGARMVLDHHA